MNPQVLKGHGVALYVNPVASAAGEDYGQFRATILHKLGFDAAEKEISGWPGYASTALHALPALAKKLGVGALYYKDESTRFGL